MLSNSCEKRINDGENVSQADYVPTTSDVTIVYFRSFMCYKLTKWERFVNYLRNDPHINK